MKNQFAPLIERLRQYFDAYGGWRALITSPLFSLSALITAINYSNWLESSEWVSLSQNMIPNLLGFSLGTYAILTSGIKRTLKALKNDKDISYLDEINATFFHFLFVQVLALIWTFIFHSTLVYDVAALSSATTWPGANLMCSALYAVGSFIGCFLLVYSVVLVLGAALAIYRLASIVEPES